VRLQELKEKLDQGFYVENLYVMARLCKSLALDLHCPTPFFVMQQIFSGIASYWDDKPLKVEDAKLVEGELVGPLKDLVDAIETEAPDEQVNPLVNRLVRAYLFLFR
jgi:hypothetical protein